MQRCEEMSQGKNTKHPIYRAEAIRRYMQSREEPVFPRLVSPRTFAYLWVLLGLIVISGFAAWFAQVPVYASGLAVVVDRGSVTQDVRIQDVAILVAFLPPGQHLQAGQNLSLQFEATGERLSRAILVVEPEVVSPAVAQRRFALEDGAALAITQPATVAIARFEPTPTGLPAHTYIGSTYHVEVIVGSRRLISFLPLMGQWFYE